VSVSETPQSSSADRLFARLQDWLPQHGLSSQMHRLARSRHPTLRKLMIRTVLRAYPQIQMTEAAEPDPFAYESFNAFFTRALRKGARASAAGERLLVSPVEGTVSQCGAIDDGRLVQAKGRSYTVAALLADELVAGRYVSGRFVCLYLAPYHYHRVHMPCDATLVRTRYVPGQLFSVNAATSRAVENLFARNERVVCEFDTSFGAVAVVLVGALFVGSIETVFAGEINPPHERRGGIRTIEAGVGRHFMKGDELGRFNMGSTVILLCASPAVTFERAVLPGAGVRLGQAIARG
jgi:phosphatidylserine decarboxylase